MEEANSAEQDIGRYRPCRRFDPQRKAVELRTPAASRRIAGGQQDGEQKPGLYGIKVPVKGGR